MQPTGVAVLVGKSRHDKSEVKAQKCIPSQFWKRGVQRSGADGAGFFRGDEDESVQCSSRLQLGTGALPVFRQDHHC